ncbi:hypothetical protein [Algoriphagus sp.]|uniref:hypothetical protein n=1 Tax=Algoriphagus sp. TaxID=1872435 RepID=UPI0026301702|nr:hypothetical protein [Algoriphagus sp.]
MKSKLLFFSFLLSLGFSWFSFFIRFDSGQDQSKIEESSLSELSTFYFDLGLVSEGNSSFEIPPFKVDWVQDGKINSIWSSEIFRYQKLAHSFFWTSGSSPLFDVKILFEQYFYTW